MDCSETRAVAGTRAAAEDGRGRWRTRLGGRERERERREASREELSRRENERRTRRLRNARESLEPLSTTNEARYITLNWPNISPDVNPIENTWFIIKRKLLQGKLVFNLKQLR
ncbi:hypothetical protein ALC60_12917 [Trachymyrmex zeteki]|uniref:Tc1-like transposase DDE domain-containing protein n=1 Tax=Mycetomoellerius zeteki TaxID=64791 RepID=A0A151WJC0_9HYME|nr:hypothetical protein ALC60_12917 [Trachymyrmex zeteki]